MLINFHAKKVVLFVFFLGYFHISSAQTLSNELYSKLPGSDQKKLQKAYELDNKGKSLEDEANQISTLAGGGIDQEKTAKKYHQKLFEAAVCYREANSQRYKIYDYNIKTFWKNYNGEKQRLNIAKTAEASAIDSFKKATEFRFMAEKSQKPDEKIALIGQARKLERISLEMMQKVLYTYLNWPVEYDPGWLMSDDLSLPTEWKNQVDANPELTTKTITKTDEDISGNDSSLYSLVQVNEDQIDMFNEFLKRTYPADFEYYIINFNKLDYSNINTIRVAWYKYLFPELKGDSARMIANVQDSSIIADTSKISKEALTDNTIQTSTSSQYYGKQKKPEKEIAEQKRTRPVKRILSEKETETSETQQNFAEIAQPEKVKSEKIVLPGKVVVNRAGIPSKVPGSLFTFRVQITACRVMLDEQTLRGIYSGDENITELFEDNWYKYSVGEYSTYLAARRLRDRIQIPGAFITAYLRGRHINATPFHPGKYLGAQIADGMDPNLIVFRVQIAACKEPLSQQFLQNIYNEQVAIDVIHEEGWYKYSLLAGKTVKEAIYLLKQVSVPGAFVVAYHQNIKLDLHAAIKFTKKYNH